MSQKPTVLVTRPLPDTVMAELNKSFEITARESFLPLSLEEMQEALASYDGILPTLGDPLQADAFSGDMKCKMLGNFGVGYNHIDVVAARAAGLQVSNTPGAVTDATADIAILLMLMAARRASEGEASVRDGSWIGWHPVQFLGQHVTGKTMGIVGFGRIGQRVAQKARYGFDMDIVCFNAGFPWESDIPGVREMGSIAELMAESDVVSINVPGGPANRHLISDAEFDAMRRHGVIVSTARGDVIEEAALVRALTQGKIASAGLDVYEFEPTVGEELRSLKNCSLLPHLGTAALEVRTEMGMMAVDNMRAFFDGNPLPNEVFE
ncbi:MAG: D-glycerate dehydrogenase [Rhodobacteraceae bacterium]|nr:D-glycerate dehydrogenase [Paracoccaceae bacterium]